MQFLIQIQLRDELHLGSTSPRPILAPTDPATVSTWTTAAFGAPDDPDGFLHRLTDHVAQADVLLTISPSPSQPLPTAGSFPVPITGVQPEPGQARDSIIASTSTFGLSDPWYSQFDGTAPQRLFTLRLSQPYTYRLQTLGNLVGVLIIAASAALLVAVIVSAVIADRLTVPIRRLTRASRSLAEGDFTSRVEERDDSAPEVAELAHAFNLMAERLQESVSFIRRDRDRSRDFLADVSHELRTPIAALLTFNELLQEGAAEDRAHARRVPGFQPGSRSSASTGWPRTCSSCPSSTRAWWPSTCVRTTCARSSRARWPAGRARRATQGGRARRRPARRASPAATRSAAHRPGAHQPHRQRPEVHARRRPGDGRACRRSRMAPSWSSPTPAWASMPPSCRTSSSASIAGTLANEQRGTGSGLGLSIVRSVVEMHGGTVSIESTLGQGTRVSVHLPREVTVSSPAGGQA